jgi:hypothetical protein
MLFGGPIGALVAGVSALFQEASGGDVGKHIAELVDDITGGGERNPALTAQAAQTPEAGAPAAKLQQAAQSLAVALAAASLNRISPVPSGETSIKMLRAAPKLPEPPASTLNRIALNPAAALGAPQGVPRHGAARLPPGRMRPKSGRKSGPRPRPRPIR